MFADPYSTLDDCHTDQPFVSSVALSDFLHQAYCGLMEREKQTI